MRNNKNKYSGRVSCSACNAFIMFLNKGISVHANVYMQPLKCGNSDIFACHIENRTYGFLAGV